MVSSTRFATTSCTTAMHVVAQAFGIRPGDEVIVTPNTFIATTLAILKEGGIPIYADIDPRTYNIDPEEVAKKVTDKTKAIFVVHYGGQMCDMDPIMAIAREHNLCGARGLRPRPWGQVQGPQGRLDRRRRVRSASTRSRT